MKITQIPTPLLGGPSNGGSVSLKPALGTGPTGPTGGTGPTGPQGPPGPGTGAGAWQPSTAYTANQVVQAPDGSMISRNATGTSRASFDATEQAAWTAVVGKAGTVAASALSDSFVGKPVAAEQVVFVSPRGSDSNDGLTLKGAKATIAAALTALGGNPGRIQLGAGTITTGATHALPGGTSIVGAGRGATTITYTGTGTLFQAVSGTRTYDGALLDVTLIGPGKTSTSVALDLVDATAFTFAGVTLNTFGTGIKHRSTMSGGALYNQFVNSFLNSCGTGVDFGASGSNGSRWHGVKFGACITAVNIVDSNQNNWHACQFEGNTTGVSIDATAAGTSDHNSLTFCRFEGNTTAWNVASSNVRDTEVIYPEHFGTYTYTDNGQRTTHVTSGAQQSKVKSSVQDATGSWVWERYGNGGSETPAARFVDSATTSGTPVTVQIETERSAGYFLRGKRGGTTYFDVDASGTIRTGASLSPVPQSTDVQIFTADGTWTKPANAKSVQVVLVGAGGGGGAGRRGAAATVRCGGGGGGGGGVTRLNIPASALASTVAVTVGVGGSAASVVSADDTNGGNGGAGTASTFGAHARANGGGGGTGGTNALGSGGAGATVAMFAAGGGASASTTGLLGPAGTGAAAAAAGGGAGGGITAADATSGGGTGGGVFSFTPTGTGTGGAAGASGTAGTAATANTGIPGQGSGGGGSSITGAAGAGAAGALYGGGGGGGGASLNGNNSGAGGAGANGIVIVTTTF